MKSPASPAVSLTETSSSKPPTAPVKPALSSTNWPKRSSVAPASKTPSGPGVSSMTSPAAPSLMPGSATDCPMGHSVYQSLQRPHLLWGAERELSLANMMISAAFSSFAIIGGNWRLAIYAAFFAFPIQWFLRMLAQKDPDYFKIYWRAWKHPHVRVAN